MVSVGQMGWVLERDMERRFLWALLVALLVVVGGVLSGCAPEGSEEQHSSGETSEVGRKDEMDGAGEAAEGSDEGEGAAPEPVRVMVPMRDGVKLETDYYLPAGEEAVPVILARSVYDKEAGAAFAGLFNALDLGLVIQDARGRGGSEGEDRLFADAGWGDNRDGVDTFRWVEHQAWCNGSIGGFGVSALGITQVLMAPVCPWLKCQAIWVAPSTFYGQLSYQGGVFRKQLCEQWTAGQENDHLLVLWQAHPAYDDYWALYDAEAHAAEVAIPGLHVGGWWDIFAQGTLNNFTTRQHEGADGARGRQMLIMGAWAHSGPLGTMVGELQMDEDFTYDINGTTVRFLQHWLTGAENGIMDEPAVRYYTVGDASDPDAPGNEWREAENWPPFETEEVRFFLHKDGSLTRESPESEEEQLTYAFDPARPVPTRGGANLIPDYGIGPMDQQALGEREDVLTFATEPLEEPMEITGDVRVKLYVSSDAPDTDFTAKLVDIYPDGREMLMLDSVRRVKFREGFDEARPLSPGKVAEIIVEVGAISVVFNKGHRIGVHVSSSNYPRFEVNPNTGADFPPHGFVPTVERPVSGEDGETGEGAEGSGDKEPPPPPIPNGVRTANNTVHMDAEHPSALVVRRPVGVQPSGSLVSIQTEVLNSQRPSRSMAVAESRLRPLFARRNQ